MKKRILFYIGACFFAVALCTMPALGQDEQPASKWESSLSIGGFLYTGNTNKFDMRSTFEIAHIDSSFEYSMWAKAIYGENEKTPNKREYNAGLKWDYHPYGRFSPFTLVSVYSDVNKSILARWRGLLGCKWTFLQNENANHSISAALQYDYDHYTEPVELHSGEMRDSQGKLRLSIRPKFKQKLGGNLSLSHVTFYQPNVSHFDDYLIESSTALTSKLNSILSIKLSYEIDYDSYASVERGKKLADNSIMVSLVFDL